jgi:hypothetical protein
MAALLDSSRWRQWMKTARHPPKYLIASLVVSVGGLLNGSVLLIVILSFRIRLCSVVPQDQTLRLGDFPNI